MAENPDSVKERIVRTDGDSHVEILEFLARTELDSLGRFHESDHLGSGTRRWASQSDDAGLAVREWEPLITGDGLLRWSREILAAWRSRPSGATTVDQAWW